MDAKLKAELFRRAVVVRAAAEKALLEAAAGLDPESIAHLASDLAGFAGGHLVAYLHATRSDGIEPVEVLAKAIGGIHVAMARNLHVNIAMGNRMRVNAGLSAISPD